VFEQRCKNRDEFEKRINVLQKEAYETAIYQAVQAAREEWERSLRPFGGGLISVTERTSSDDVLPSNYLDVVYNVNGKVVKFSHHCYRPSSAETTEQLVRSSVIKHIGNVIAQEIVAPHPVRPVNNCVHSSIWVFVNRPSFRQQNAFAQDFDPLTQYESPFKEQHHWCRECGALRVEGKGEWMLSNRLGGADEP
jgi:hypothetical protein